MDFFFTFIKMLSNVNFISMAIKKVLLSVLIATISKFGYLFQTFTDFVFAFDVEENENISIFSMLSLFSN